MRTLGRGKREKEAVSGAFQWSRGEAPKAALRLSPTFAAVNGQRMKPHAVSATIKARAKPHATARRMLSKSPLGPERPMRPIHSANRQARRPRDEKPMRTMAPEARTGELASRRGLAIPMPPRVVRQSAFVADGSPLLHVSVRVRLCGQKGAASRRAPSEYPRRAINSLLKPFTQSQGDKRPRFAEPCASNRRLNGPHARRSFSVHP